MGFVLYCVCVFKQPCVLTYVPDLQRNSFSPTVDVFGAPLPSDLWSVLMTVTVGCNVYHLMTAVTQEH